MRHLLTCLAAFLLSQVAALHAIEFKLAGMLTDQAVLKRECSIPVWGWANLGAP